MSDHPHDDAAPEHDIAHPAPANEPAPAVVEDDDDGVADSDVAFDSQSGSNCASRHTPMAIVTARAAKVACRVTLPWLRL